MTAWICANCTLKNAAELTTCEVCQQPRPNSASKNHAGNDRKNDNVETTWTCGNCTLTNPISTNICETCSKRRNPRDSSCPQVPDVSTNVEITYVWEWKGGGEWLEYPDEVSAKIDEAYFNGTLKFDVELSRGEYEIDLTKLHQKSKDTGRTRKIQRVKWEYDPSKAEEEEEVSNDDLKMDVEDTPTTLTLKKSDDTNNTSNTNAHDDGVQKMDTASPRDNKLSTLSSDPDTDIDSNMKDLSVDNKPLKRRRKKSPKKGKKNTTAPDNQLLHSNSTKKKTKRKKQRKGDTLLGVFDDDKNEDPPAALTSLKKKTKKRKLSEVLTDEEDVSNDITASKPAVKKRKTSDSSPRAVKISTKYSTKQATGQSGAELNKTLIDALWELSMIERNAGNRFKANAYSKACKTLRNCGVKITSGKDAQKMDGIGKKIALKIDELLSTGKLVKLDKLRADDTVQAVNELCQVHGIGPKKAAELVRDFKIFSLEDLRKRQDLLNHQQKIGLKYFEQINKRIPRDQCTKIGDIVGEEMKKIDSKIRYEICGSYRRGAADCGDVDILLTHPDPKYDNKNQCKQLLSSIVRSLRECGLLVEDLAHGPVKYMGICKYREELPESVPNTFQFNIPDFDDDAGDDIMITLDARSESMVLDQEQPFYYRRIDLKFINFKFFYANLLYFTGSDALNIWMRKEANAKYMILNENGLYEMLDEDDHSKKSKEPVITPTSEKDIFDRIGIDYIEPKDRSW